MFPPSQYLFVFPCSHSAVSHHPYLQLPLFPSMSFSCWIPSVPSSPSFPLSLLAGFMGSWCMVISLQTHLSAHSLSSFPSLLLSSCCSAGLRAVRWCLWDVYIRSVCIWNRVKCMARTEVGRTQQNGAMKCRRVKTNTEDDEPEQWINSKHITTERPTQRRAELKWNPREANMQRKNPSLIFKNQYEKTIYPSIQSHYLVSYLCSKKQW